MRPLRPFSLPIAVFLLALAPPLGAQAGADSAKARADTTKPSPDSTKSGGLFGPASDLGLQMNGRLESKLDRTQNERCVASQFFSLASQCTASFQPAFDFQFNVKTGGTVADRVHVNMDYDSQREMDASNRISLYYEGKKGDWLQRVDLGNVSFELPASRFITSGIPQGNYGVQAVAQFGKLRMRGIFAQQTGNVVRERPYTIGAMGSRQPVARDVNDYEVEARRFFFVVDPRRLAGYPNIDILNGTQLRQLAASLPDSVRPVKVSLYRLLLGGQPPNPNGPQFRLIGDPSSRRGQIYEPLRENIDYVVDPSQLWVALKQPLSPGSDRLVVAYTVRIAGRDTTVLSTGGTPDVNFTPRDQWAALLWDPNVRPGDDAFFREIRSAYRVGGDEVVRESVSLGVFTGATFDQQKPLAGSAQTFLQLFGLAQLSNPTQFDYDNRLWPRPGDPVAAIGLSASTRAIADHYIIFPSLQPFARAGLAQPAGNPANDDIYASPSEYLYSPQHPQVVYHLRLGYQSEGGTGNTTLSLGVNQIRPLSEHLVLDDGTVLKRDRDYSIEYEVGMVTFLHPDSLFSRQRTVTARFEENPSLVPTTPTSIFGFASTYPFRNGDLNMLAIGQRQSSSLTRPTLGYESQSSLLAGVNGAFHWEVPALSRALGALKGANAKAPSLLRLEAELATSRPQLGGGGQAWLESFEGDAGVGGLTIDDPNWYLSSQPALGRKLSARIGGATTLDLSRAATMAWQNNALAPNGKTVVVYLPQIDPLTNIAGAGIQSPEKVLWLTLYPLAVGGAYNDLNHKWQWATQNLTPGKRWRSIRQPLGGSGADLSRVDDIEFWVRIDTASLRRQRNPTLVFDLGDVSENTVAVGPKQLIVTKNGGVVDSSYTGRVILGRDTLQTERDPFSRAFNQEKNDIGLPGDRIPRLLFASPDSSGTLTNFPMCSRGNTRLVPLGDTRNNCTVANGRLDEWDLDGDGVLNFDSSQREQERLLRYVVNLADPKTYVRVGGCGAVDSDTTGTPGSTCWVFVRVPFGAPTDTVNGGPLIRRVRTMRLTMISGDALPDNAFSQVAIAGLKLRGAPWLRRADRALSGIGGQRPSIGLLFASTIGTQDKDSLSGLVYDSPPGVVDQPNQKLIGIENQRIVINERSMRLTATQLNKYERIESYYRFPEGAKNFLQYRELRAWAKGRGNGWGATGELQFFVKIGRDADNFYMYRTSVNAGTGQGAWLPEVRVDFDKLQALRSKLQNSWLRNRPDSISCTGVDSALIVASGLPLGQAAHRRAACADGYMVYTIDPAVSAPNLAAVQELAVGIVRVDSGGLGASRILAGDTLEVWVDDIRLASAVNTPGYAGHAGVDLVAGDVGTLHVSMSQRDPNFRQLGDVPTNVGDDMLDISSTLRLEKLAPQLGLTMPVTIVHSSSAMTPQFVTHSDIRGSDIDGLRTPKADLTSVALSLRRTTPLDHGWVAPIVNGLVVTTAVNTASTRSEFDSGKSSLFTAGVDWLLGASTARRAMPEWWTHALAGLPEWLASAEMVQAMRASQLNVQPVTIHVNSSYAKGDDERSSYTTPAAALTDTARTVNGATNLWRNTTSLELRPVDALSARWEVASSRDLRHYTDTSLTAATANAERTTLLGVGGLERERYVSSTYSFSPQLRGWFRPRADLTTSYGLLRDPNAPQVLREYDSLGVYRLPRRVNAMQQLTSGAQIDLARVAGGWISDSASRARLSTTLLPFDINYSRTLTSAFDGTPFTPGLEYQFGLGGLDAFLRDHDQLATTAGSNAQLALHTGVRLPMGIVIDAGTRRVATRNWIRRADQTQGVVDGEQVTLPDLTVRGTLHPKSLQDFITSLGWSARLAITQQRTAVPSSTLDTPADIRTSRVISYPLGANVEFADQGRLRASFNVSTSYRLDSLPGTIADSKTNEMNADVSRTFPLPATWQMRSPLRTRFGWQQQSATTWVINDLIAGTKSRLADNGRQAFSLNADTDIAENLTFSLQGAHITTFDNNLNRRFTQVVFSTVLQIAFFAGELR
ncbi:MAG: cell surface protein SprA [Gemmatimonadetes bacterium]|nr:cell surface protein SprA [Gemmatimonadota bacterium]